MNQQIEKQGMSGCAKVAIGCSVALLIVVIALGIGAYFVVKNIQSWASQLIAAGVVEMVEQSDVPADQKQRIAARINRLQQDFADGKITGEQLGRVVEAISRSGVFAAATAMYVDAAVIQPSNLAAEEKTRARQTIQRFTQGLFDQSITDAQARAALAPILKDPSAPQWDFKDNPTEAELRQALTNMEQAADTAGVAAQPEQINFADELDKAIDQALGGGASP